MAVIIPLEALPNQELSVQLDGVRYVIRLRTVNGVMALDLTLDEVEIVRGERLHASEFFIPYDYLEGDGGNFVFVTDDGDYPFWTEFEISQSLVYFTAEEMAEARGN